MSISDRRYIPTDFWVSIFPLPENFVAFYLELRGTGKSGVVYKEGLIDIQGGSGDKSGL
jgi:hypothetical protein